jgi:hypothetical protein
MLDRIRRTVGENKLKGSRISSFRILRTRWQDIASLVSIGCLLGGVVQSVHSVGAPRTLFWIGITATLFSGSSYIRFYEKGLEIPRTAGGVFLSRDQLFTMRLEEDRFIVTGPDAVWGGPYYSGGVFRLHREDLPKFRDVLTSFLGS